MYHRTDEIIGSGGMATVYHGIGNGKPVAIKLFHDTTSEELALKECKNCAHMKQFNIDGVVRYLHVTQGEPYDGGVYQVVMEKLEGKELLDRIINAGKFSEGAAATVMFNLLNTVHDIHNTAGVVHVDLKAENIVYVNPDENSPFRVVDFGLSLIMTPDTIVKGRQFSNIFGSPNYIAPEVLFNRIYSSKSDMWSVGACLRDARYIPCGVDGISSEALDLVSKLLHKDASIRYSASEALNHPWIQRFFPKGMASSSMNWFSRSESESEAIFGPKYFEGLKKVSAKERLRRAVKRVVTLNYFRTSIIRDHEEELNQGGDDGQGVDIEIDGTLTDDLSCDDYDMSCNTSLAATLGGNSLSSMAAAKEYLRDDTSSISSAATLEGAGENGSFNKKRKMGTKKIQTTEANASSNNISSLCKKRIKGPYDQSTPSSNSSSSLNLNGNNSQLPLSSPAKHHKLRSLSNEVLITLKNKFIEKMSSIHNNNSSAPICLNTAVSINFYTYCEILTSLQLDHFAREYIFDMFDHNKVGLIDYRDFLVTLVTLATDTDQSAHMYFSMFDSNGDGKLSPDELHFVLASMVQIKEQSAAAEVRSISASDDSLSSSSPEKERNKVALLFFDMDSNNDGEISFEEFQKWFDVNFLAIRDAFIPIFNE